MLQTLEAVITPSGWVKFNESFTLDHSVKAYITILPDSTIVTPALGENLLQLLESKAFSQAALGDVEILERQVQANRNAWND